MDIVIGVLAAASVLVILMAVVRPITILEYQRGLRYHKGRFRSVLAPGRYWRIGFTSRIDVVDVRERVVTVAGQEVMTQDGVSIKVSISARYQIVDPNRAVNLVESYADAMYAELQLNLRGLIGAVVIEDLLGQRATIGTQLTAQSSERCEAIGLRLERVEIKDIMFPGDLKKTFSQVANARQQGLAALERARGETAALRNLANAATLVDKNHALMQLRMLHTMGESTGNTFVVGWPQSLDTPPNVVQPKGDDRG